ncbi:TonB-dependent vitamin B12 receptor [Pseudomonas segetis]|uniref:Vitamin B12 transporter n=1 Tax=Pseudomonas segetis TaxID=298908 RepID=A0A238ZUW2_9PSED|nr:TonB-dependent vitamin B12 receptor [Pseudomonas segetis]SNR87019.1 vitamin B12 transporter [Pseudomonas segetis]
MKSKSFLTSAAVVLCGVSSGSQVFAAEPNQLEDSVVTATRTAQTAEQSLSAITVFDRADIEQSQVNSVPELLRKVPGVSLANNGGPGKSTSLFMRGTESDHVLVMIDGVKIGSVSSGGAALQDLPLELIERIEVVRGPRSSLYGSEAIGGVIQIFTRKGRSGGAKPFFSAGYGTHDSYTGSAGVSGGDDKAWYSLGVSSSDTDGINVKSANVSGYESDDDGYRNLSGSLSAGYRFDNGLELDGNVLKAKSHNDYDSVNRSRTSGFNANADGESNVYGGRARFSPFDIWQVTLQVGRSEDKSDAYTDGSFNSRFDSRRDTASWQNDLSIAEGQTLTLGTDYQRDEISGSTDYDSDSRDNNGYFIQYLGDVGRHDWQLALRRDDNEQFGDHQTGNIAYGFALTDWLRSTVSYGTAFKAPTFNELYFPDYGNPNLDAETSQSLEIGLTGQHAWGHWSINAFRNEIDDLIAYDSSIQGPSNVDKARINGVELVVASQLLGFDWNANYTLMDPENQSSGANDGNELARRAKQLFNLDVDRRIGRFSIGGTVHAEGQRYDDLANTKELSGFATVDLRGEYRLTEEWRLQSRVANLLGADYETAEGYNQPGQAVYFSVRYQAL